MLLLLGTPDQLRFVVFSLGCMNLYLLILSLGFDAPSPNRLLPLFHLSTAFILFAAFYTIFPVSYTHLDVYKRQAEKRYCISSLAYRVENGLSYFCCMVVPP